MAQACRAMCHDLYKEGFMAIAHLGTRAGGDASGLQRSDPQHTSAVRDIDRLYRQGELVAQAFDNVKRGVQIGDDRVAVQFKEVSHPQSLPKDHQLTATKRHKTTSSHPSATPSTTSSTQHRLAPSGSALQAGYATGRRRVGGRWWGIGL